MGWFTSSNSNSNQEPRFGNADHDKSAYHQGWADYRQKEANDAASRGDYETARWKQRDADSSRNQADWYSRG